MSDAAGRARTVSVVVPCFNSGALLREAVGSVLAQQGSALFSLLEVFVVDDGSDDGETLAALEELKQAPLVKILSNARRKGPAGARNTGAFAARGAWLAFLDSDDVWLPESLEARFRALSEFPDAKLISGDFQIWDPATGSLEANFFASRERTAPHYEPAYRRGGAVRITRPAHESLSTVLCHSCSALVDRELFRAVGGYEESLTYKEDQHLWFKLEQETDLIVVPHSVFLYRQHATNMTRAVAPPFDYQRRMFDFILSENPSREVITAIQERYPQGIADNASWYRAKREFRKAFDQCIEILPRYPFNKYLWIQIIAAFLKRK